MYRVAILSLIDRPRGLTFKYENGTKDGRSPMNQSRNPRDRMGVYKRLADVPPEYRLESYSDRYENESTYEQFLEQHFFDRFDSERTVEKAKLAGRRWRNHMNAAGRHHALARPSDVEAWMENLLDRVSMNTAYNIYWVKISKFYTWLQRRVDHPHLYHPFFMAAAEYPVAGRVWAKKIARGRGGTDE